MSLRRVCNVAYAALVENRTADERRHLDALLTGTPVPGPAGARPVPRTDAAATNALMAAMMMPQKA